MWCSLNLPSLARSAAIKRLSRCQRMPAYFIRTARAAESAAFEWQGGASLRSQPVPNVGIGDCASPQPSKPVIL